MAVVSREFLAEDAAVGAHELIVVDPYQLAGRLMGRNWA